jgi:hypothetical protein
MKKVFVKECVSENECLLVYRRLPRDAIIFHVADLCHYFKLVSNYSLYNDLS